MGRLPRSSGGDRRVGIVGAGAAGLAVAHALQQRGYRHITVLEREERIGGKCFTFSFEGRSYELGAAALTVSYRNVHALMAEVGMQSLVALTNSFVDLEGGSRSRMPLPWSRQWGRLGPQAARMAHELWRHREIRRPGFQQVSPELCAPFEAWCNDRHVELMGELVKPWITGFGYGFYRDIPAAYMLKYMNLFTPPLFEVRDGYGALWERVARSLVGVSIRLGVSIEQIARDDDQVRVHTNQGVFDFDALVLACPLDAAVTFLDATPVEKELFSLIRYYDYYVAVTSAEGLPRVRCLFFPRYFSPEYVGRPMFAYQRWPGQGLTLFYGFALHRNDDPAVREAVYTTVDRLGGSVRTTKSIKFWRYFPHVAPDDMARGFYSRLEELQGQRATYYCGELLAFGTVENTVGYSRALVERYFPAIH